MDSKNVGTIGTVLSVAGGVIAGIAAIMGSKENAERTAENQRAFDQRMQRCDQAAERCERVAERCEDLLGRTKAITGAYPDYGKEC